MVRLLCDAWRAVRPKEGQMEEDKRGNRLLSSDTLQISEIKLRGRGMLVSDGMRLWFDGSNAS